MVSLATKESLNQSSQHILATGKKKGANSAGDPKEFQRAVAKLRQIDAYNYLACADNENASKEHGFGRSHSAAQSIKSVDFTSHAKLFSFGLTFFDQLSGAQSVIG